MIKRFIPLAVAVALLIPLLLLPVSATGQEPWNYEDYVHNIDYEDGYNDVLVEIPAMASFLEVYATNTDGQRVWHNHTYGTLLKGAWPSNYFNFRAWFNPIDSMKPLELTNVPNGSTISVQITLSGSNYSFDGFNFAMYYLDSNFETLRVENYWQDYQSHQTYEIDFEIQKPANAKYVCVQNSVSGIRDLTAGGDYQIEFTRTQLVMSIDALYMQQQITQQNNALLNKINDDLDKIANSEVTPSAPAGADSVGDLGELEEDLFNSAQDGLDQADTIFNNAPGIVALYSSGFLFMANVIEHFASAGWISGILTVSLALGLLGFIANIAVAVVRSSGKGKGGKG